MKTFIEKYQLIVVVGTIAALWILWQLKFVCAVLFGGYIVASALLPVVSFLAQHRIPRIIAVVLVGVSVAAVFTLPWVILAVRFNVALPNIGTTVGDQLESVISALSPIGIDATRIQEWLSTSAVSLTSSTIGAVAGVLTTLVIGLYLAYDWPRLLNRIEEMSGTRTWVRGVIEKQAAELAAWTVGQLALVVLVGFATYVLLTVINFPYALALGLMAGVAELVPYAGPIASAIPAVFIALQMGWSETLVVLALYVAIQQIENHILVPLVMRRAVYIHPVVIIAVILIGFSAMGIVGALLAVPLTAILWTTYKELRTRTRE